MAGVPAPGRADLTDAQWAVLQPLRPVGRKPGRRAHLRGVASRRPSTNLATRQPDRKAQGKHGGRPPTINRQIYKQRHAVECGTNRLNQRRAMATRDTLALRYQATTDIAAINLNTG